MPTTETFTYTGSVQTWTVPSEVSEVTIRCWGGAGGDGNFEGVSTGETTESTGDPGGYAEGVLSVSEDDTLYIYVGGQGGVGAGTGSWPNGGDGASTESDASYSYWAESGGGGGSSSVRHNNDSTSDRVILAGGGGGGSSAYTQNDDTGHETTSGGAGGGTGEDTADASTADAFAAGATGGGSGGWNGGSGSKHFNADDVQAAAGGGGGGVDGGEGGNAAGDGTGTTDREAVASGGAGGDGYVGGVSSASQSTASNNGDGVVEIEYKQPPATPDNVSATVDSNDQITLSWEKDDSGGSIDEYYIDIDRDGTGFVDPSGGPATVSDDDSSSYTATYTPNSDSPYDTQVGIDSSFQFRVAASGSDGTSDWATSGAVYTDPIPPHNPSVSRPDANTIRIDAENKSDLGDIIVSIWIRADTGNGYGSWQWVDQSSYSNLPHDLTTSDTLQEDARYQIRIRSKNPDASSNSNRFSEWVYADYGNNDNVYFEDDFESGDLSNWSSDRGLNESNSGVVQNESTPGTGISGSDEGSYHLRLDADDYVATPVLDTTTSDTDVMVRARVATGSMDTTGDYGVVQVIDRNDSDGWFDVQSWGWEYNKQGWHQIAAIIPSQHLSQKMNIRFKGKGNASDDHLVVDRVVVSDILHEYTKPATPSGLSLDNSTDSEITASWTNNASLLDTSLMHGVRLDYKKTSDSTWTKEINGDKVESGTISGLVDGERYDMRTFTFYAQPRNGSIRFHRSGKATRQITTRLPAPTSLSVSNITQDAADLSWTDNSNNEDAYRVYTERADDPTGMNFDGSDYITIPDNHTTNIGIPFTLFFRGKMSGLDYSNGTGRLHFFLTKGAPGANKDGWSMGYDNRDNDDAFRWNVGEENVSNWGQGTAYSKKNPGMFTVAMVVESNSITAYFNGSQVSSSAIQNPLVKTGYPVKIGQDAAARHMEGKSFECAIYDRKLSDSEISDLDNSIVPADGLVGYWPLDLNQSGTTPDLSEYANDGTVNGPTLTGAGLTDMSGELAAGTEAYTLQNLLNGEQYNAYVHAETDHNIVRDN